MRNMNNDVANATLNRVTSRYMGSLSDFRQSFESRHSPCMMDVMSDSGTEHALSAAISSLKTLRIDREIFIAVTDRFGN